MILKTKVLSRVFWIRGDGPLGEYFTSGKMVICVCNVVLRDKNLKSMFQEEVLGTGLPPLTGVTPQTGGSLSPLPSGRPCCVDMPPWSGYENGPSC